MAAHGGTRAGGKHPPDVGALRPALVRGALATMAAAWVAVIAHASGSRGAALPLALALLAAAATLAFLLTARGVRGKPSADRFGELTTERALALGDRAGLRRFFARVLTLATLAFLVAAVISAAFPGRLVAAGMVAALLAPAFLALIGMIGRGGASGWIVDLTVADAGAAAWMAAHGEGQQFRWGWSRTGRLAGLRAFLAQDGDAPAAARAVLWARYAPGAGVIRPEMRIKSVLDELRARRAGWRTAAAVCVAAAMAAMLAASLIPRGTLGSVPPLGALQFWPPDKAEAPAPDSPASGSGAQPDPGGSDRQSSGPSAGEDSPQGSGASGGRPDSASGGGAAPAEGQGGTEGSEEAGGAGTAPMGGQDNAGAGEDHAAQDASDGAAPGQGAAMDGRASADDRADASPGSDGSVESGTPGGGQSRGGAPDDGASGDGTPGDDGSSGSFPGSEPSATGDGGGDGARTRPDVTDSEPRPAGPETGPGKATQEEGVAGADDAAGLEQVHPADTTQDAKPEGMAAGAAEGADGAGAEDAPGPGQAHPANATATDGGADTAPDAAAGALIGSDAQEKGDEATAAATVDAPTGTPNPADAGTPAVADAQEEGDEATTAATAETPANADQEDIEIGAAATLFAEEGAVPEAVERTFGPQDQNPPSAPGSPSPPRQPLPAWIEALLP